MNLICSPLRSACTVRVDEETTRNYRQPCRQNPRKNQGSSEALGLVSCLRFAMVRLCLISILRHASGLKTHRFPKTFGSLELALFAFYERLSRSPYTSYRCIRVGADPWGLGRLLIDAFGTFYPGSVLCSFVFEIVLLCTAPSRTGSMMRNGAMLPSDAGAERWIRQLVLATVLVPFLLLLPAPTATTPCKTQPASSRCGYCRAVMNRQTPSVRGF